MAKIALLLVALVASSPFVGALAERDGTEVANLVAVHVRQSGTLLAWQPMPGAASYTIYRATGADAYVLLGETPEPLFYDAEGLADATYLVLAQGEHATPFPPGVQPSGGQCVAASLTGVSITARNCVPNNVWATIGA